MTERELLEMAAKAAGIDTRRLPEAWPERFDDDQWNPLIDDGDALRLAVKLKILIFASSDAQAITGDARCFTEQFGADEVAAIRRAIVRAAAEIGKAMP